MSWVSLNYGFMFLRGRVAVVGPCFGDISGHATVLAAGCTVLDGSDVCNYYITSWPSLAV